MRGSRADHNKILELKKSGLANYQIAIELGCHIDTVRKHLGRNGESYGGNNGPAPPAKRVFSLSVGQKISAYEPDISAVRNVYMVTDIGKYVYTARRAHGYPWKVSFPIKDFGMPSDRAHVKCLS